MPRLRRRSGEFHFSAIAAEVLETRSLLSGAAAVHAAVHHALTPHPAAPSPTPAVKGTFIAELKINGNLAPEPGVVSLAPLNPVVGGRLKGSFTTSAKIGANSIVEKTTLSGKIVNSASVPGGTSFTIQPSGGSFAVTVKAPGKPSVSASAPFTTSYTVIVSGGIVADITAHYKFGASAGGGLANKTVDFDLVLD